MKTRYEEIYQQVKCFHEKNPDVWQLFCRFTIDRIKVGFKNYSAKAIFERIRWEQGNVGGDGISEFKMNNNYHAFYARAFMKAYPEYKGFFRIREQKSQGEAALNRNELTPENYK